MNRWDTPEYQTIILASAHLLEPIVDITFANGDKVWLPCSQIVPIVDEFDTNKFDWERMTFTAYEIKIPRKAGEPHFFPWNYIRLLTDKEFEAFWLKQQQEINKRVGRVG